MAQLFCASEELGFLFLSLQQGSKTMKTVEIIVAATPAGEIGYCNTIPWRLRGDLRRFREKTMGNVVIMGRRTYESLTVPLSGRTVVVVSKPMLDNTLMSHQSSCELAKSIRGQGLGVMVSVHPEEQCTVCIAPSVDKAIKIGLECQGDKIFLAGGTRVYEWGLSNPIVDKVHLTTSYKHAPNGYDARIKDFAIHHWQLKGEPEVVFEYDERTHQTLVSHTYSEYVRP
jgi:dihydrofolate reductase